MEEAETVQVDEGTEFQFDVELNDEDEEAEEESEIVADASKVLVIDDDFDTEGVDVKKGPLMPRSPPNMDGLTEAQMFEILGKMSEAEIDELSKKNTESFRCLAQVLMSHSSDMKQLLYFFPELEDPGIDAACTYAEAEITFDDIGIVQYQTLCKDMNIAPISRVIRSLDTDTLDLKYYGLSDKDLKAICKSLMLNTYVKKLILEDNWISPKAAMILNEMLLENDAINVLNLRECRLGKEGIVHCFDGFSLNQSLREIDLSFNDLGDEGATWVSEALKDNYNIEKINLSHNNLGERSGELLGALLKDHANIDFLDLSWNNLYEGKAMVHLMKGAAESDGLESLNLSWNGIGTPQNFGPLAKYLKESQKLQYLDLSFNRLVGNLIGILAAAVKTNDSLKHLKVGFNLITPTDALKLVSVMREGHPLEVMDLQNVFVNKAFVPILKNITDQGKTVIIEEIIDNYTILGPDKRRVIFDRCRYLALKPKKKKQKKDFGSFFIWNLRDEIVDTARLKKLIKASKIKLDNDLIEMLGELFSPKKKRIELKLMRETYLQYYPDTKPPPVKTKKEKKGKKGAKKHIRPEENVQPPTEEKGIGTDSLPMTESSIVSAKFMGGDNDIVLASAEFDPAVSETVISTMQFDKVDYASFVSLVMPKESQKLISAMKSMDRMKASQSTTKQQTVGFRDAIDVDTID